MFEDHQLIKREMLGKVSVTPQKSVSLYATSPSVYHGSPRMSQIAIDNISAHAKSFLREELLYFNNTPLQISVVMRNGLKIEIPYSGDMDNEDFIIRRSYTFKSATIRHVYNALKFLRDIDNGELMLIKEQMCESMISQYELVTVMIDYHINKQELDINNGTIYHQPTDLVISSDIEADPKHPYSTAFVNIGAFGKQYEYTDLSGLHVHIRYVNHNPRARGKFVKLLGQVYYLKPDRDGPAKHVYVKSKEKGLHIKEFDDYVEIYYSGYSKEDAENVRGLKSVRATIEEARLKWGIFDTYHEAAEESDAEILHKKRIREMELETEKLKAKAALDKVEFERIENERRIELASVNFQTEQLKHINIKQKQEFENLQQQYQERVLKQKELEESIRRARIDFDERIKRNSEYWRDHYEQRNHERKDKSEGFKYFATISIAAVGLVTAIVKLNSKSS